MLDEAAKAELATVINGFSVESRAYVLALEEQDIILLHRGLGAGIRNEFRANRLPALSRWARTQIGAEPPSFDALSYPVLVEIWRAVRETESGTKA
jgi:hypothetical protein